MTAVKASEQNPIIAHRKLYTRDFTTQMLKKNCFKSFNKVSVFQVAFCLTFFISHQHAKFIQKFFLYSV